MEQGKIRPARHLVWYHRREIDLNDPDERKRYYEQVLNHGRAEDVSALDPDEIRRLLPNLRLSDTIRKLWEDFFNANPEPPPGKQEDLDRGTRNNLGGVHEDS